MSHLCLAALSRPAFVAQFQSITDDARHSGVTLTGKFILSEVGNNAFLNFPQDSTLASQLANELWNL